MRRRVGVGGVVLAMVAALYGCHGARRPDASKVARLRVLAKPEQASVYVDDRFAGAARVLAVRPHSLPPGRHFITVKAPDHFPHDLMVDLNTGTTTIEVALRPIPP